MIRLDITEPNSNVIKKLMELHVSDVKLKDYYEGKHDILNRKFADETKPNNKIVTNFCKYITDSSIGYFIGEPVSYSSADKTYIEKMQDVFDYNDEQNVNAKIAKDCSIYGQAYEILYTTTDTNGALHIRFDHLDQSEQNVILVYDRSIEKNLVMAIRYFDYMDIETEETITEIYAYTSNTIYQYQMSGEDITLIGEQMHYFDDVPINVYYNRSEDAKGDFEDVITLNDAYNLLQSDDINESNYSNDAYLVIKNLMAEKEDIENMKEQRAIRVDGDGEVSWLIKDINDAWKENIKTRIVNDIHKISGVPDMTDENFAGNASGVAMKFKLLAFENNRVSKERMFKKSLQRRIELITNMLNRQGNNYDYREINMTFTPNLPANIAEQIDSVVKLIGTGLVSKDTLMNQLSFIEDAASEKEKIAQENEEYVDLGGALDVNEENTGINGTSNE